jgi:uncharacterized protein YjiS (DUF1127 family)
MWKSGLPASQNGFSVQPFSRVWNLRRVMHVVSFRSQRTSQRHRLATLSDRELRDFGLTRHDDLHEARKNFWRA